MELVSSTFHKARVSMHGFKSFLYIAFIFFLGCDIGFADGSNYVDESQTLASPSESIDGGQLKIVDAAKKLVRELMISAQQVNESDIETWKKALTMLLGSSFDLDHVRSIIEEVKNEQKISDELRDMEGECPSSLEQSISQQDDHFDPSGSEQLKFGADRHAARLLDIVEDPDCLEREFDASSPFFDTDKARHVLVKCRVLVLRNVFSRETTDRVFPAYIRYIRDITSGHLPSEGTTSFGGDYFILKEDNARYNYMATELLVQQSTGLLDNEIITDILSDPTVLGEDVILNHVGTIQAYPGATAQHWHTDGPYVANEHPESESASSFERVGVGGHDLSPYAINLFTPMIPKDMTLADGPTEFCMGTSLLRGHDYEVDLPVVNRSLLFEKNGIVEDVQEFEWMVEHGSHAECPSRLLRIPLLNKGDALLFDYQVTHRGGANQNLKNQEGRSMIFATYSRRWFRDTNYDNSPHKAESYLEELTRLTRYAVT